MSYEDQVVRELPEIEMIGDEMLRRMVVQVYAAAMKRGGWTSLRDVPFTLLLRSERNFLDHIRFVTRTAVFIARERGDLDLDVVCAGALLHDIGKLLEYRADGKGKSELGRLVRHPISGAGLAMEFGLPGNVVHVIATHSREGEGVERTPEAILVHHCDFIDFEIERSKHHA